MEIYLANCLIQVDGFQKLGRDVLKLLGDMHLIFEKKDTLTWVYSTLWEAHE